MHELDQVFRFENTKCIVTGAANGIGEAISKRFAEAGSELIILDIDEKKLNVVKQGLLDKGHSVQAYKVDLSKRKEISIFWDQINGKDIDFLINNAGAFPFQKFLSLDEDQLEKIMNINLYSVIWMCQSFISNRLKKGGKIVNIGSIEAILPFKKDLVQYSLSKSGVITLTRDLSREFADKKFNINVIIPGGIKTKGTMDAAKSALINFDLNLLQDAYNFKQRLPAKRFGTADEIAKIAIMLCSDIASYVHGAMIPVDGGFLAN